MNFKKMSLVLGYYIWKLEHMETSILGSTNDTVPASYHGNLARETTIFIQLLLKKKFKNLPSYTHTVQLNPWGTKYRSEFIYASVTVYSSCLCKYCVMIVGCIGQNNDCSSEVSLHRRIAHLRFPYTEG